MLLRFAPLAMTALLLASCAATPTWKGAGLPAATEVGQSVGGRPIPLYDLGTGSEVVLIMATIHGNENAGTPLCRDLMLFLDQHPEIMAGKRVVVLPVVNPDGYADDRRFNANGVDLNRNFEAANRRENRRSGDTPLSEPESRVIKQVLEEYKPSRIVSMHEPLKVIDWDGPGEELARHMGRFTDLPVERLGSRAGSLGSYAGEELGIPIITLEFPRGAGDRPPEELWRDYGRALLAAITFPNDPPELPR
ncbi:DUF2817 domain-containing protein [bacterium]|nr:DUF2817 domain-containing protein [bacterium]